MLSHMLPDLLLTTNSVSIPRSAHASTIERCIFLAASIYSLPLLPRLLASSRTAISIALIQSEEPSVE